MTEWNEVTRARLEHSTKVAYYGLAKAHQRDVAAALERIAALEAALRASMGLRPEQREALR